MPVLEHLPVVRGLKNQEANGERGITSLRVM